VACLDRQGCQRLWHLVFCNLLSLLLTAGPKYLHLFVFQVLRSGEELEYEVVMQPLQTLVPVHKYDQLPSYFIYAGVYVCMRVREHVFNMCINLCM